MLFTTILATATSLIGVFAAPSKRQAAPTGSCVLGVHEVELDRPFVLPVARECLNDVPDGNSFWNTSICVAAGIATGITQLTDFGACYTNLTVPLPGALGPLDQTIFSTITKGKDGATQQDFVDFFYDELADKELLTVPDSQAEFASYYVNNIFNFLHQGFATTISYDGFNSWLHNSGYANHFQVL
ncbi:unnamed protein product [Peniophora sp. CBMAI 1063]|nr:unnamed protein product [Peniophora sp. CBMAI 1063]